MPLARARAAAQALRFSARTAAPGPDAGAGPPTAPSDPPDLVELYRWLAALPLQLGALAEARTDIAASREALARGALHRQPRWPTPAEQDATARAIDLHDSLAAILDAAIRYAEMNR